MAELSKYWLKRINEHSEMIAIMASNKKLLGEISRAAELILKSYQAGGKLLLCGNGGSAADAQHLAAELVSRFYMERQAIDAEALTINSSTITAIGNDYSYDVIFARQVEAKGRSGDALIGITTSGNSTNIIKAIQKAKAIGMVTIGFTGSREGTAILKEAGCCIAVPSEVTPRVQEAHILIGHMLCEYLEEQLGKSSS